MNLQEEHAVLDEELAYMLIRAIPDDWYSFVIEVEWVCDSGNRESMNSVIKSLEGKQDVVGLSDEMASVLFKHIDVFKKYGKPWKRYTMVLNKDESGGWDMEINYKY